MLLTWNMHTFLNSWIYHHPPQIKTDLLCVEEKQLRLLSSLAKKKSIRKSNKGWLFICGRPFFFKEETETEFRWQVRKKMHRPGIEPGPPAWQASILPLNQRCFHIKHPKKKFKIIIWHFLSKDEACQGGLQSKEPSRPITKDVPLSSC